MKIGKALITIGLLALTLAFGFKVARAQEDRLPVESSSSPIHPGYAMLDANGENVLTSGGAVSTMQTCGQCHDTDFIVSHSYHADLGLSSYQSHTETWNASDGLFGEFDPFTYRYLSGEEDERIDLTTPDWLMTYGWRVPGGGPAVRPALQQEQSGNEYRQPGNRGAGTLGLVGIRHYRDELLPLPHDLPEQ